MMVGPLHLGLVFVVVAYLRGAVSQEDVLVTEYEFYKCGTEDAQMACFCGYLEDQLALSRNFVTSRNSAGPSACYEGVACTPDQDYPCSDIELLSLVGLDTLNSVSGSSSDKANDVWGWSDPDGPLEVAIIGVSRGTAFVDVTNPTQPVFLGTLPSHNGGASSWRDIKTYGNHAYIVSEATNHGMQVFDLTLLRTASSGTVFTETTHYDLFGSSHNIFIHEETAVAYVVGARTGSFPCDGGFHMIDLTNPATPQFISCFADDGYAHDVQCVIYNGDDTTYTGKEICFSCNEDTVTIVDVTDKSAPAILSRTGYSPRGYTHQGWLTEDHNYFLFGDESDESTAGLNTTTLVLDVSDLDNAVVTGRHFGPERAIDHNQYTLGKYTYQANYRAGLRILEIVDPSTAMLEERAFFDIFPSSDSSNFNGAWSVYPYLPSGVIVLSVIERGLFVLRWNNDGSSTQSNAQCLGGPPGTTPAPAPSSDSSDNDDDNSCKFDIFFVICLVKKILFSIFDFITFWD